MAFIAQPTDVFHYMARKNRAVRHQRRVKENIWYKYVRILKKIGRLVDRSAERKHTLIRCCSDTVHGFWVHCPMVGSCVGT